ncbi:MAG TPA: hypothetical protein V6C97_26780 [Oculatellaceae cyanobacterium]
MNSIITALAILAVDVVALWLLSGQKGLDQTTTPIHDDDQPPNDDD